MNKKQSDIIQMIRNAPDINVDQRVAVIPMQEYLALLQMKKDLDLKPKILGSSYYHDFFIVNDDDFAMQTKEIIDSLRKEKYALSDKLRNLQNQKPKTFFEKLIDLF